MRKFIVIPISVFLLSLSIWGLIGCGGASSERLSHMDLAIHFVDAMNFDLGYRVDLVKIHTVEPDSIVIYDNRTNMYNGMYIGNYDFGDDIGRYFDRYEDRFYYNLTAKGDRYEHWTGVIFEETQNSLSRSSSAIQQHEYNIIHQARVELIQERYGLSHKRAITMATIAENTQTLLSTGALTDAEVSRFSEEAFGIPSAEFIRIGAENDLDAGEKAIKTAARVNNMGENHARQLAKDFAQKFGLDFY